MVFRNYIKLILNFVIFVVCIILFFRTFIFEIGVVNGRSMEPTYFDNDFFVVNKFELLFRSPRKGDIVQFIDRATNTVIIKRIIGVPGETIILDKGDVYVMDKGERVKFKESYLSDNMPTFAPNKKIMEYVVRENEFFVLGDNRTESNDSRIFGTVYRGDILGAVD